MRQPTKLQSAILDLMHDGMEMDPRDIVQKLHERWMHYHPSATARAARKLVARGVLVARMVGEQTTLASQRSTNQQNKSTTPTFVYRRPM